MLTRRQLLKMGVIGGAAVLVPWERGVVALASGTTTPRFAVELPIPPVLTPTGTDATTDYYDLDMRTADVEILPGQLTRVWAYDGLFPGPTIAARSNRRAVVTQHNSLHVPTSVHLHGAHTSAASDGHPTDYITPGSSKVYTYPNDQLASTLWYHDHTMHDTSRNVYMGLAGAYVLTDDVEDALDLPGGDYDVPLIIMDRSFNPDGSLLFSGSMDRVIGDTILVNGKPWPSMTVGARRYRLRVLNASNSREYELALDSGDDLVQIGSDGGLLAAPYATPSIPVVPAERVEVIIDFAQFPVGTSVVLKNLRGSAVNGTDDIMRFDVAQQESDPTVIPPALREIAPIGQPQVTRDFELTFDFGLGLWVINGQPFDEDRVDVRPQLDVPEVWRVLNSAGAPHPFHIHLSMFQVLDRDGVPPHPGEAGWKDTVQVNPGETVSVLTVFTGYTGRYVYHCHNLAHEDHDMMAQMEVVPGPSLAPGLQRLAGANRYATAALVSAATFSPGVGAVFVATGRDYPDALAGGAAAAAEGGPVLLVGPQAVPTETADELDRLQPARIIVLGGPEAVGEAVVTDLGRFGPVQRLGGANRYATAALVSAATFSPGADVVFVATGRDYPDGLTGGAAAAAEGGPVLLVGPQAVPTETAEELERLQPGQIVVLGGPEAVGEAVVTDLGRFGPVERLGGADRYATAALVSAATFPQASTVFVATGRDHSDALSGGAAAAAADAPLLLVTPDAVPGVIGDELTRLAPTHIALLGGPGAVGEQVAEALRGYLA